MVNIPKPKILLLSLNKQPFFSDMYSGLLKALAARADLVEAAIILPELSPSEYSAVFVTDEAISERKHASVLSRVIDYTRAGGIVVIGGHFSSLVRLDDLDNHFHIWGLPWKKAGYRRSTCVLNPATHPGFRSNGSLPKSYSMKVLSLQGVAPGDIVYRRTECDVSVKEDPMAPVDEGAVTYARVGSGYIGYIGDVNAEQESTNVVLALCGLPL